MRAADRSIAPRRAGAAGGSERSDEEKRAGSLTLNWCVTTIPFAHSVSDQLKRRDCMAAKKKAAKKKPAKRKTKKTTRKAKR